MSTVRDETGREIYTATMTLVGERPHPIGRIGSRLAAEHPGSTVPEMA